MSKKNQDKDKAKDQDKDQDKDQGKDAKDGTSQDDLAKTWQDSIDKTGIPEIIPANQDDVDEIFGWHDMEHTVSLDKNRKLWATFTNTLHEYEAMPMADMVFEQFIQSTAKSFRMLTGSYTDITINSVSSKRFCDYIDDLPLPAIFVIFRIIEWDNLGVCVLSYGIIETILGMLLGGHNFGMRKNLKRFFSKHTGIERTLLEKAVEILLENLSMAFSIVAPVNMILDHTESSPKLVHITQKSSAVLAASIKLNIDGTQGFVDFILPHTTIAPIKDKLARAPSSDMTGHDTMWDSQIAQKAAMLKIPMQALLEEQSISFQQLNKMLSDKTYKLPLKARPDTPVVLRAGKIKIATGNVGQAKNHIAIRVKSKFHKS